MNSPKLQFDFPNLHDHKNNCIAFTNPLNVITATDLDDVEIALHKVQEAIDQGYYVAGYMSYEATYAFYKINYMKKNHLPLLWFGVFQQPEHNPLFSNQTTTHVYNWKMGELEDEYVANIERILQRIESGETKQVNYTVPFTSQIQRDTFAYYNQLKRTQQANYNAYLQIDHVDILSVSPELFFSLKNNIVTVRPMKGTVERGKTYEEDIKRRKWLQQSEKNKIENDLITNLMKTELQTIANDVYVEQKYTVEKYPTVYQMTSTIKGNLQPSVHPVDVLKSLFPCGSITGVPKEKTIEIIAELENQHRGVYCGAIGYFTPNKEAIFNVPIRTVTVNNETNVAKYYAGGAITENSTPNEEFNEVIAKTEVINNVYPNFKLLETILINDGEMFLQSKHIKRLTQSAEYFNFHIDLQHLNDTFTQLIETYDRGMWRTRLLLDQHGKLETEVIPLETTTKTKVTLANEPIDKNNVFLYHKTTERSMFDVHRNRLKEDELDILLWNEHGEITEFTIGNVVVELNGKLLTPPVRSGLLSGTFREQLIEEGKIKEEYIYVNDLNDVTAIWLINSVRKWVKVTLEK